MASGGGVPVDMGMPSRGDGGDGSDGGVGSDGGSGGDMGMATACPMSPAPFADGMAFSYTADADWVYGFDSQSAIVRVPRNGGAPEPLVTGVGATSGDIFVDDQNLFWEFLGTSSFHQLLRAPKTGGSATTIYAGDLSSALAMDADRFYFMSTSNIMKWVPKAGGPPMEFGQTHADGIWMAGVDSTYANYVTIDDSPNALTWTFNRIPKAGGSEEVLAKSTVAGDFPHPFSDDHYIFAWIGRSLVRVSTSDGTLVVLHDGPGDRFVSAALDDTHLYWTSTDGTSHWWLMRIDKTGANATVLFDSPTALGQGLTVTGDSVYFSSPQILRLCR